MHTCMHTYIHTYIHTYVDTHHTHRRERTHISWPLLSSASVKIWLALDLRDPSFYVSRGVSVFSITTFITDRSRAVLVFARQPIRARAVTQYCTQVGWHGSVFALQQTEAGFEYKPETGHSNWSISCFSSVLLGEQRKPASRKTAGQLPHH